MKSATQEMDASRSSPSRKTVGAGGASLKAIAFVARFLLRVCIVVIVVEGLASIVFVVRDFVSYETRGPDMVHSTQFDPELGWVNIPNLKDPNFYGPGLYLQTNSRGFRNREEFTREVPAGKLRVICAGDSMTFGPGVDDDHTWCQQLAALNPRLQPINMAVPGYGADQMYLLQLREASQLDYDVQIFAVVTDDFRRATVSKFFGYGKPVLELRGGELVTTHVPVRKASKLSHFTYWLPNFKSVKLLQEIGGRFRPTLFSPSEGTVMDRGTAEKITTRILENLQAVNRRKNSVTVVVILPIMPEVANTGPTVTWRGFLRSECGKRGIPFIDLIDEARTMPASESGKLFISIPKRYSYTYGHLSDFGNEYFSHKIYEVLTANPEVARKLSGLH